MTTEIVSTDKKMIEIHGFSFTQNELYRLAYRKADGKESKYFVKFVSAFKSKAGDLLLNVLKMTTEGNYEYRNFRADRILSATAL